jgi:gliding motility-associated-like protein
VYWSGTGAQSVSVNYTNGNLCTAATPVVYNVTINDNPTVDLSINSTTVCENQDLGLSGNPSGGIIPYVTHAWTGTGATYLTPSDQQTTTFNSDTPNTYDLVYQVTDNNGCKGSDNMSITVLEGPTVFAGIDTTICYDGDYKILDATATNYTAISWINSTTGDGTGFDDPTALLPTYTPSEDDKLAGFVTLTMTINSASCGSVSDDLVLTLAPELVASVGGISPYMIDVATTVIRVTVWATHEDVTQLAFYLVSPSGTEIKLYDYNSTTDGCDAWDIFTTEIDSLVFSLNSNSSGSFNLCDFAGSTDPVTGEYSPEDSWLAIDGEDPAEGGWSVRIEDTFAGSQGNLERARITFKDINQQGNLQTIVFDSKEINYPINDNSLTTYTVPIGLRTSCAGACDARAIVNVTGGTLPIASYVWSSGDTGSEVDLCGGDHTVTVTDSRGCISVATVEVLEPDPMILKFDSTNVACYGDSSGMVKVTVTQGEGSYTYQWDDENNSTTAQVDNLPFGTYTVTVTDGNGCPAIGSVTITQPSVPLSLTYVVAPTDCNATTGTITLTPAGGSPFTVGDSYDYTWTHDAGLVGNEATLLAVGAYNVLIQDSLGCTIDTTINMIDNGDMVITGFTMLNEISCAGSCDGEVQVNFTGGNGTYAYNWSGSGLTGSDPTLAGVCGDSAYSVTVTDVATTCSAADFYSIPQPDSIKFSIISQTDVLCYGDSTGAAEITVSGGSGNYTYVWYTENNDTLNTTSAIANNLPFGKVYIDVKDDYLCTYTDSILINEPTALTADTDALASDCIVPNGEAAVINMAGGTPFSVGESYQYLWDANAGNQTNDTAFNLLSGVYDVTISDANGCALVKSVIVPSNSTLALSVDPATIVDVLCFGDSNGEAIALASGGSGVYTYAWDSPDGDTDHAVMLSAGTQNVTVTDDAGCSAFASFTVGEPTELVVIDTTVANPLCYGGTDGSATINVGGGTIPYTFAWPNGESTTETANGLVAGTYAVTVTDFNGCQNTASVVVTDPQPVTFDFEMVRTTCGDSIGQLNVTNLVGGTGTYTTDWASPDWASYPAADTINTDTIRNLWVANYVAIVTDGNGCMFRDSISLKDNSNMAVVLDSSAMVACNGGSNGALLVHGTNGTEPYSYLWNTGDADSLLNDVVAGTYTLQVVDDQFCKRDTSFTITEPDAIQNNWVFTKPIVCHGDTTASFYANVSGGVSPYTYLWDDGQNTILGTDSVLKDKGPDWYYLTVIDQSNCIYKDSIHIFNPDLMALSFVQGKTACADSTGWAEVSVSGGVAPYTYNWYQLSNPTQPLDGQFTDSAFHLWVDVFVVEVTDSLGCITADTIAIEDDSNLDFTYVIHNHVSCVDKCDGSAEVTLVTGGVQNASLFGYDVEWESGETDPLATNLCIGSNRVFVIDALGCKAVKNVQITDEDALKVSIAYGNDISQGVEDCNGYADATVSGGVPPYNYLWSTTDNNTSTGIVGLCEGWYYVTVTDASAAPTCEVVDSVFIANDPLRYDTVLLQHIECYGSNTGAITIQAFGGYPGAYTYEWANKNWASYPVADSTGSSISNLVAGRYYFTITDAADTKINDSIDVLQPEAFIPDYGITETNCYDSSGVIIVNEANIQGGTPPFTYLWGHESWTADSTGVSLSNLWVDNFYVTITDANGCQYYDTVAMEDNSPFIIDPIVVMSIRCNGFTDGSIDANPSNGAEPYNFSWESGQNTQVLTGLGTANYIVTVVDDEGCVRTDSLVLTEPEPITFTLKDTVLNDCYTDCSGSISFDNAQGGSGTGWNYVLRNNDGVVQEGSDTTLINICPGDYEVRVEDSKGCLSELMPFVFLSRSPQMIPQFEIIDTATCNNNTTDGELAIKISMGYFDQVSPTWVNEIITYNYRWDDNPALRNDTLPQALGGEHFVLVSDNLGCENTFYTTMPSKWVIWIDTSYIMSSRLKEDYFCPGDTVQLFAQATGADSITWSNTDYLVGNKTGSLVNAVGRTDKIFFTTAYFNSCYDEDTLIVGRYQIDTLIASIQDGKERIFVGNEVEITANTPELTYSADGLFDVLHAYTWTADVNEGLEWNPSPPDTIAPKVRPSVNTIFTVYDTIRIYNEAYSNQTCVLSDTVSLEVLPEFEPATGFTPNGDGWFDIWELPGIQGFNSVEVQVFNRWGGLIWEHSGDYQGNEWDGTNTKGNAVPSGTYYFIIIYGDDSGSKTLTGPVTILR